jgi:hypothetical protein
MASSLSLHITRLPRTITVTGPAVSVPSGGGGASGVWRGAGDGGRGWEGARPQWGEVKTTGPGCLAMG